MKKEFLIFIWAVLLTIIMIGVTSAGDTGWVAPSANANNGWSNPEYVYTSDDSHAVANSNSDIVNYFNFGFSIPTDAIINGIEFQVEGYNTGSRNAEVSLSWDGGSTYTSFKTTSVRVDSSYPYTDGISTLGGSSDKWNRAWSPLEFSNSNFRIKLDATSGSGPDLYIDQIKVKVYYTIFGCTDPVALNYNSESDTDDGSCEYPICGDGDLNGEEECDDTNTDDGDGCSSSCLIETKWYMDADEDGYGFFSELLLAVSQPEGYVKDNTDCDDNDATAYQILTGYQDNDEDTFTVGEEEEFCTNGELPEGYIPYQNEEYDCDDNDDTKSTDCTAPITTATGILVECEPTEEEPDLCIYESGTWTNMEVEIELNCEDESDCETYYLINGEETDEELYFFDSGIYTVTYWSVDEVGNLEEENTFTVKITSPGPEGIGGNWQFPEGSSPNSAQWIILQDDLTITLADGSSVFLVAGTMITSVDGSDLDLSALTFNAGDDFLLSGFEDWIVTEGSLQFGIPSFGLEFSQAITISIFVGTDLNGQTLNIIRSVLGNEGWTNEGIVNPTCVVDFGICEFETTLASFFATTSGSAPVATTTSPAVSQRGGGGGGTTCTTTWTCTEWSICATETQTRRCSYPENFCTPTTIKPVEVQSCTVALIPLANTNTENEPLEEITNSEIQTPIVSSGVTGAVIGFAKSGRGIISIIFVLGIAGAFVITLTIKKRR